MSSNKRHEIIRGVHSGETYPLQTLYSSFKNGAQQVKKHRVINSKEPFVFVLIDALSYTEHQTRGPHPPG